jgi:hypothetical protein
MAVGQQLPVVGWLYEEDAKCLKDTGSARIYEVEQAFLLMRKPAHEALARQSDAMAAIAAAQWLPNSVPVPQNTAQAELMAKLGMAWLRLHASERLKQSAAASDVLAERQRQIGAEGYAPEHDDEHVNGEIAAMAAFYAMPDGARDWPATETGYGETFGEAIKPDCWDAKTGDRRRELVKAGALILAEIERLDRAAAAANAAGGV